MTRASAKRKAAGEPVVRPTKKTKVKAGKAAKARTTKPLSPRKLIQKPSARSDPHKRALVEFTNAELQMAKYMNELLSHGIRAYAFGFLIQETRMSLWYVDRMGMATSESFDMFLNPELLLLVVAALHSSDRHKLGVIPLIKYPDGASQSHNKATLDLPYASDGEGESISESLSFRLRVTPKSPLVVAYGAIGRGTTVVPISAEGRALETFGGEKLVAKLSWPSVHRKSEASIIQVVRLKLGEHEEGKKYLKNIVDLKCSLDMTATELGLPRAFMDLSEPFESRLLRTLVMKEYLPLEHIRSLGDFKIVYKHVLEGISFYLSYVDKDIHNEICSASLGVRSCGNSTSGSESQQLFLLLRSRWQDRRYSC